MPSSFAAARGAFWLIVLGLVSSSVTAQVPPQVPPSAQAQLQVQQPLVDNSGPVTADARFEPPISIPGEKVLYRVTVDAVQNTVVWPAPFTPPDGLKLIRSADGQTTRLDGNRFRPKTTYLFEMTAERTGTFIVPAFNLQVGEETVTVPGATLDIKTETASPPEPPRMLLLELSETNVFFGQPVRARVILPAAHGNQIDALRDPQLNGDGFMTDKTSVRQAVETIRINNLAMPAYVYEVRITPFNLGKINLSAQGYSAGRDFGGPISISGQVIIVGGNPSYDLILSEEKTLNVRPLPAKGELPGFTGAIGKFLADAPKLSTNRVRVGEPVHIAFAFQGLNNQTRYVPPEIPRSRDWQIIADNPPGNGFTLIPLSDEPTNTPAIPFSAFDPETEYYYDLTIPALPITVISDGLPSQLSDWQRDESKTAPAKLGPPSLSQGKTASSLRPLQLQGWFIMVQLLPVIGLLALWRWDERRRFLAAHPEIVRRLQARRALRRERKHIRQSVINADQDAFIAHTLTAIQVVSAPHFPAEPRALVQADVLSLLSPSERDGRPGEIIRKIFTAANAQYDRGSAKALPMELAGEIENLLKSLEAKL